MGGLFILGELSQNGEKVVKFDEAAVGVWHAPSPLRAAFNYHLMKEVLDEMSSKRANWSYFTTAFSWLDPRSSALLEEGNEMSFLKQLEESWSGAPICTSAIIVFWQKY